MGKILDWKKLQLYKLLFEKLHKTWERIWAKLCLIDAVFAATICFSQIVAGN